MTQYPNKQTKHAHNPLGLVWPGFFSGSSNIFVISPAKLCKWKGSMCQSTSEGDGVIFYCIHGGKKVVPTGSSPRSSAWCNRNTIWEHSSWYWPWRCYEDHYNWRYEESLYLSRDNVYGWRYLSFGWFCWAGVIHEAISISCFFNGHVPFMWWCNLDYQNFFEGISLIPHFDWASHVLQIIYKLKSMSSKVL